MQGTRCQVKIIYMEFAVPNWEPSWYLKNCELSNFVFSNKGTLNVYLHLNVCLKCYIFKWYSGIWSLSKIQSFQRLMFLKLFKDKVFLESTSRIHLTF